MPNVISIIQNKPKNNIDMTIWSEIGIGSLTHHTLKNQFGTSFSINSLSIDGLYSIHLVDLNELKIDGGNDAVMIDSLSNPNDISYTISKDSAIISGPSKKTGYNTKVNRYSSVESYDDKGKVAQVSSYENDINKDTLGLTYKTAASEKTINY